MSAISGTRRKVQELADGTLRVLVDIDPRFKADFHRLFPAIDMPIALAPLNPDFEKWDEETRPQPEKQGALCRLAAMWCKDKTFQQWLTEEHGGQFFGEKEAAQWIRKTCGVDSRSMIDQYENTAAAFMERVRAPFRVWMEKKVGERR